MTHDELVRRAADWLFWSQGCGVVLTELVTGISETPDAIGWRAQGSILVECKASRADFLAEKWKQFRRHPEIGVGELRYYLAPKGLLLAEELPPLWGLIEPAGERMKYVKRAERQACCKTGETVLLVSALRRMVGPEHTGIACRVYHEIGARVNRASVGVLADGAEILVEDQC